MRFILFLFILSIFSGVLSINTYAQHPEEQQIRALMQQQTAAWNEGDLNGFMQTYWQSDSLMFIGKSGVTYSWQATLDNYKKSYPDTAAMGKLNFNLLEFKPLTPVLYFVVGKWHLQRTAGDLQGHFSLLIRKINGEWKIVADHSS
ncbi:YybH family protein [Chitinophaga defluvii]|uniref:Nuclear transport factor 2 family protein n=1 Tax=Chitinophaga defluvii TaxID=3163343 RepID=A0ABV2T9Z1_9BACT